MPSSVVTFPIQWEIKQLRNSITIMTLQKNGGKLQITDGKLNKIDYYCVQNMQFEMLRKQLFIT